MNIVLDCMGGDEAPLSNLEGALLSLKEREDFTISLVGDEEKIRSFLEDKSYDSSRIEIIPTTEVITYHDHPVEAIQTKKDSSLTAGLKLLKDKKADGFVSAGSTGAILVGAQLLAGRLPGVKRSPLCIALPTLKGKSVLIDCGANVDANAKQLRQFAVMGSVYAKEFLGIENPTVGLVNIGTEEEKGNLLTKEAYALLKDTPGIHFIGNAEARDIPFGVADVYVCEAFTGNVVLKMYEGTAKALLKEIKAALHKNLISKIGGLLIKPALKDLVRKFDSSEDGGAPMLGLSGLVMKAHGNSTKVQIKNAILECAEFSDRKVTEKMKEALDGLKTEKESL